MSLVKPIYNILSQTEEKILAIIKENPRASFRTILLLLGDDYGAQEVWDCLRLLQNSRIVEIVKVSNKKIGYQLQAWCSKAGRNQYNPI